MEWKILPFRGIPPWAVCASVAISGAYSDQYCVAQQYSERLAIMAATTIRVMHKRYDHDEQAVVERED